MNLFVDLVIDQAIMLDDNTIRSRISVCLSLTHMHAQTIMLINVKH